MGLYPDLHAVCKEMGIHASCAAQLYYALADMGCRHLSEVHGMDLDEIRARKRIGPQAARLARALGAREAG